LAPSSDSRDPISVAAQVSGECDVESCEAATKMQKRASRAGTCPAKGVISSDIAPTMSAGGQGLMKQKGRAESRADLGADTEKLVSY
jgi:hypothetical protein